MDSQFRSDEFYIEEIARLRKEKNAVILVHNYQRPGIQDIADFLGDSLELSRKAAKSDADVIVFCGVQFMAESASILCPEKTVLLPSQGAGCPLADMININGLKELKKKHPKAEVVCYINTTADIKAVSDVCCTSGNAVEVVNSLDAKEVIFIPDENLGNYVQTKTDKKLIMWKGFCPSHIILKLEEVLEMKKKYPKARFLVHPECTLDILEHADGVFGTGGMVKYVQQSEAKEFIIGTEDGLIYRLAKEHPTKKFYLASNKMLCANMKLTNLKRVYESLSEMKHVVKVPEEIRLKAKKTLDRMLQVV